MTPVCKRYMTCRRMDRTAWMFNCKPKHFLTDRPALITSCTHDSPVVGRRQVYNSKVKIAYTTNNKIQILQRLEVQVYTAVSAFVHDSSQC